MRKPADSLSQTPLQPGEQPARKKRRASGSLECKLGLLLGLAGLAGSRLGQLWIAFDVFSQFTLQFAVVTAAFLIGWAMPRAKLLTAFVVLVIGIVGIGVWPHVASRVPTVTGQAAAGERALKVVSFNTLWTNENAEAVRAEIERIDADIVNLVEMGPAKRPILAELKGRYPYQSHCYDVDFCNFVILSKLPFEEIGARGKWDGPPFISVRLGPEAGGLAVFGVHTIRFPHSQAQFRQVMEIARLIEKTPGPRLVMGDFNATPFSRILSTLQDSANLQRLTNLPSWPSQAGLPQIAIDHIFVSPGLKLLEAEEIGEPSGSDHYPVTVKIAVPLKP
ncbi:endonuclease/exonuclease/phosphatase family protein [Aestuariivirga sp.]|uniref:endonuclease/exonuclease/phosphatase family protein n=1 Tax=Aestuariivirga sp. TaxID=2650926 RepID=UPI003BABAFF8